MHEGCELRVRAAEQRGALARRHAPKAQLQQQRRKAAGLVHLDCSSVREDGCGAVGVEALGRQVAVEVDQRLRILALEQVFVCRIGP